MPCGSRRSPETRALTRNLSALSPCSTNVLAPSSTKRQPEQPELGVFGPQLPAKTFRRLHVGLARLELVMVRQQSLDAVLEQPLLLVQLEVHLSESRGSIVMAGPGSSPGQVLVPAIHA